MGYKFNTANNIKRILNAYEIKKVLDVGCGDLIYKSLFKEQDLIGIDVEESGRKSNQKNPDFYFDGINIPFEENTFDLVLCTEVIEHAVEPEELINEIRRVLKPSGYLYLTVPMMFGEHETPYDFRRYTSFGLKKLLSSSFREIWFEKTEIGIDAIKTIINSEFKSNIVVNGKLKTNIFYFILKLTFIFMKLFQVKFDRIYIQNHIFVQKLDK